MSGFGRHFMREVACPFCGKGKIMAFYKEGYVQTSTSSISAGKKYTPHSKGETYEFQSGCPVCGKTVKEVQKAFDTGVTREIPLEERLRRMRESGLPTKFGSGKNG